MIESLGWPVSSHIYKERRDLIIGSCAKWAVDSVHMSRWVEVEKLNIDRIFIAPQVLRSRM